MKTEAGKLITNTEIWQREPAITYRILRAGCGDLDGGDSLWAIALKRFGWDKTSEYNNAFNKVSSALWHSGYLSLAGLGN